MPRFATIAIVTASLFFNTIKGFSQIDSAGWQPLFNEKNLEGWKQLNGKADYKAVNDEIIGTTVSGEPNSFLTTEKLYSDFILELEMLVDTSMNSGIQIRSQSSADYMNGRVHGYQVEVDPSLREWSGGLYDEARRGWLYTLEYNPAGKKAFRNNEWNKYHIECIGNSIRTWINGIPTANLIDEVDPKGFIALQVHAIPNSAQPGKQIHWRKIRIKTTDIQASPADSIFVANTIANNISPQETANGYSMLWDGKTNNGWRGAYKKSFPSRGWEIKDGVIKVLLSAGGESTNGGDIVTTCTYSAFELKFDFKLSEGANSGVKYFVTEKENNKGSAIGLEYQLLDDERHPDAKLGLNGDRTLASLYDLAASTKIPASQKKIGEWNQGMIRVYPDNRVEHWLYGYKVLEYTRGSKEFLDMVSKSKFQNRANFGMADKGHILLQDHGTAVSFRSLKIKEFK